MHVYVSYLRTKLRTFGDTKRRLPGRENPGTHQEARRLRQPPTTLPHTETDMRIRYPRKYEINVL